MDNPGCYIVDVIFHLRARACGIPQALTKAHLQLALGRFIFQSAPAVTLSIIGHSVMLQAIYPATRKTLVTTPLPHIENQLRQQIVARFPAICGEMLLDDVSVIYQGGSRSRSLIT